MEWSAITDATVASLVGRVDEAGADIVARVGMVADVTNDRFVVDLAHVSAIDEHGIELLEALSRLRNVVVLNVSDVVVDAMERHGRLGF